MDRREVIPGDTEFSLGLLVEAEELVDRSRGHDLPVRQAFRDRSAEETQLLAGLEAAVHRRARLLRQRSEDGVPPLGKVLESPVIELLQMAEPPKLRVSDLRIA